MIVNAKDEIVLYNYRWIIITIYCLYCFVNFFQFPELTIIADIIGRYYGVGPFLVDLLGLVFMISFILLFIPIGYLVENHSLKTTSISCVGLNAVGNCLKLLATNPDTFYLLLIAQTICSVAQIYMLIIPTKIASTWFGAKEVSTACSLGLFGTQFGVSIGTLIPPFVVSDSEDGNLVSKGLKAMYFYNAVFSVAMLVVVIIFFSSNPPSPPSRSQITICTLKEQNTMTYAKAIKGFIRNKDFMILLFTLGLAYGLWNALTVIISQMYTSYFPDGDIKNIGLLFFIANISGGCFGTVIFGFLMDRTSNFKLISFLLLLSNTISFLGQSVSFTWKNELGTSIFIPLNGFFSSSYIVVCFEYAIETTYPTPEAFGAGVINTMVYIVAIVFVVIIDLISGRIGYLIGNIIMVICLACCTVGVLFMSGELKRRDENLKVSKNVNEMHA